MTKWFYKKNKAIAISAAVLMALLVAACGDHSSSSEISNSSGQSMVQSDWAGAWSASPYGPYPLGPLSMVPGGLGLPLPTLFLNNHAVDQSFRMIVRPTIAGSMIRIRLSNLMGDRPVTFRPVRVARSLMLTGPALVPGTDMPVLFGGKPGVTVPPGEEAVSDPVEFAYAIGSDLAISFILSIMTNSIILGWWLLVLTS